MTQDILDVFEEWSDEYDWINSKSADDDMKYAFFGGWQASEQRILELLDSSEMENAVIDAITSAHAAYLDGAHDFDDISKNYGLAQAALAAIKQKIGE